MKEDKLPLVVDLDGTLTPTDTLVESALQVIKKNPANIIKMAMVLSKGKVEFKNFVAANSQTRTETLPYRELFLDYLRNEKNKGRKLVLATASHKSVADGVATHLGIFDEVIATESTNLKGLNKLDAIRQKLGDGFVYAGDSKADLPIWESANAAVLVGASKSTAQTARTICDVEAEFASNPTSLKTWFKALRVHQWLKNVLIFVPILTAFSFLNLENISQAFLAFISFSLIASSTYVFNDLWDLDNDRRHPRKKSRPLASGDISIISGLLVSLLFMTMGFSIAWGMSIEFFMMLLLYLTITSSYSWVLKRYVLLDVIVLSLLYTLRIVAGSVAIGVATSTWLLAFSVFFFLSLALIKRCSELTAIKDQGKEVTSGRDYRVTDLTVLWPLGVGSAISAVVVFGLFISAPETAERYASPMLLWLVALSLIYWLSRLWIKTARGQMHDDPVVYAIEDRGSRVVILCMTAVMVAAHYIDVGFV